jgi:DNA-binding response OmpR family regulator
MGAILTPMGNSYKILIIDDDVAFKRVITDAFIEAGHTVIEAGDGIEGFEVAQKELPDIILMDVLMPQKTGTSTLKDLKSNKSTKDIPVLMLTQVDSMNTVANTVADGSSGYIVKNQLSVDEIINRTLSTFEKKS